MVVQLYTPVNAVGERLLITGGDHVTWLTALHPPRQHDRSSLLSLGYRACHTSHSFDPHPHAIYKPVSMEEEKKIHKIEKTTTTTKTLKQTK